MGKEKKDNLIHVKLDYEEALDSRQKILAVEMDLLNLIKRMRAFKELRTTEMKLKLQLAKKLKEASLDITKINHSLPEVEVPEVKEMEPMRYIEKQYDESLEMQLKEIQQKLRAIQK